MPSFTKPNIKKFNLAMIVDGDSFIVFKITNSKHSLKGSIFTNQAPPIAWLRKGNFAGQCLPSPFNRS